MSAPVVVFDHHHLPVHTLAPGPNPISRKSTTPELSSHAGGTERSSSEATIFTIYSMYGADDDRANSLDDGGGGRVVAAAFKKSSFYMSPGRRSTGDLPVSPRFSSSVADENKLPAMGAVNGLAAAPAIAYRDRDVHHRASILRNSILTPSTTITTTYSSSADQQHPPSHPRPPRSRPPSYYRTSQYSIITNDNEQPTARMVALPPRRRTSSQPQLHRKSIYSVHDQVNLPPIPVIAIPPCSPIRSRGPSPTTSFSNLRLTTPPRKGLPSPSLASSKVSPTPSSLTSLVPSEGEDLDGFHVRTTYAQLDSRGVKGDGFKDGVERTRARVGSSRASQMHAEGALADGTEKNGDLDPQELEALSKLDRYGFFDLPSHDRLVLLPSAPLRKRLSRVSAGPSTVPPSPTYLPSIPPLPAPLKESSRIGKWTRMLVPETRDVGSNIQTWALRPSKSAKLRERTYKGIPDRWRSAVWELLISQTTHGGQQEVARLEAAFQDELDKPSQYDVQIDLDVPRTISGHIMFRTRYGAGQRFLFQVLHSFSLHCSQCGYVQGMGPIAATLLCYTTPSHVYATLVRLHTHPFYSLHSLFSPGFPGLLEAIYVQERIIESMMPDVFRSFRDNMISTTSYATKWYITLFANSVPFQCQLRLWDVFLLEGKDLFVIVAVAIVWAHRDHITSPSANFETVLSLLSSFFIPEDENLLLAWIERALSDKKLRANMDQWRCDWQALVAQGKDGTVLL